MTWVKLDDNFPDHPAIRSLTDGAYRLFVDALCYCSRYLTDGLVPGEFVDGRHRKAAAELVERRRWFVEGEGWRIHDYLVYQESREKVLARREAATKRKQKQRSHGVTDTVTTNGTHAVRHTTPDPTRPVSTFSVSPTGRDAPSQPNPSRSYAAAEAARRAALEQEPTKAEADDAFPAGLHAARIAARSLKVVNGD
jgi:hypothetical protein